MINKIEYIKDIFNIKGENKHIIISIAEEIDKIEDFNDFRNWIKINLNHADTKYIKSFDKFIFLMNLYMKEYIEFKNRKRIKNGKKYAKKLSNKIKQISHLVENETLSILNIKTKNNKDFFNDFDKSQIKKIGGIKSAVNLQKSISGSDALNDKLEKLAYNLGSCPST